MNLKHCIVISTITILIGVLVVSFSIEPAANAQQMQSPKSSANRAAKILLIPLDDRPPCLQFVQLIGDIGDAKVVAPPRELLGRFTEPGKPEAIARWMREQNLKSFDAAIISLDMLAYGGLVASRVHNVNLADALKRLEVVEEIHKRAPRLKIYGSSVIMRLAPTGDVKNEAYREKLAHWAEISPEAATNESTRSEVAQLEQEIPQDALRNYRLARERNLKINFAAIDSIKRGVFDYLILSQDDAKPRGVHVADRERLIAEVKKSKLENRIAVQPGADEVSMLLLARALTKHFNYAPHIYAVYSSEATRNDFMPFEDRPLNQTVSFQIAAAGAREVKQAKDADILFFVYASRKEKGAAEKFAKEIKNLFGSVKHIIVADIDPGGDVQGADPKFTEELRKQIPFSQLAGYASWNTAGNTIGTALPQGIVSAISSQNADPVKLTRAAKANAKFLLHRLLDDYAYHTLVRPEAKKFIAANHFNPLRMNDDETRRVEALVREKILPFVDPFRRDFMEIMQISQFQINLPWNRTFEAEIDFNVQFADSERRKAESGEEFFVAPKKTRRAAVKKP